MPLNESGFDVLKFSPFLPPYVSLFFTSGGRKGTYVLVEKNMPFVGLERTPSAFRADVLIRLNLHLALMMMSANANVQCLDRSLLLSHYLESSIIFCSERPTEHLRTCYHITALIFVLLLCIFSVQCIISYITFPISKVEFNDRAAPIPCSSLNVSELHLITFDVFGALMLTQSSLKRNIAALLPSLSPADVQNFTNDWLLAYQSYFGKSISPSITHQLFQWVIHSSLIQLLESYGLASEVPEDSETFRALLSSWANLEPKVGATEVLAKLTTKYQLGILSNGDTNTLRSVLRVFPPSINISVILSSDYPVNCFKPCPLMYAQALNAVNGDKTRVIHVAGSAFDSHGARLFGIYSGALDPLAMKTKPKPCFAFNDIKELISFFKV